MMSAKKTMRRTTLISTFVGALLLAACAETSLPVSHSTPSPVLYRNLEATTSQLDLQNAAGIISAYRKLKGLGPVVVDPALVLLAQNHATAQAKADKVGHSVGGAFRKRVRALEDRRGSSVENVSAGYRSFAQAFSGWRGSKAHNANLLNKKVTRMGIAKAVNPSSKFKVFWTLVMTSEPL